MQIPVAPFTVLALAPTRPDVDHPSNPELISTDLFSLDETLSTAGPSFMVPVPLQLCHEGRLTIHIKTMKNFRPESLVQEVPYLKSLYDAGRLIEEGLASGWPPEKIAGRL